MWEESAARLPGQVWTEVDLSEARRRLRHLLGPMRSLVHLLPEQPAWITMQLVDLLDQSAGLPVLGEREIQRHIRYRRLLLSVERLVTWQFDLDIAAGRDEEEPDSRRPETGDDTIAELMDTEAVRPRTFDELADDLREEAARAHLLERAAEGLAGAAALVRAGDVEPAAAKVGWVQDILYAEMNALGDFRTRLLD